MKRAFAAAVSLLAAFAGAATEDSTIPPFSAMTPAPGIPAGWSEVRLPHWKAPDYALVADEGSTVLRVHSQAAAGSLARALSMQPVEHTTLAWRWKIDRVVEHGDLETRAGDDYAARVYVFFDVPDSALPFGMRAKMKIARLIYGGDVPGAALCYVWDNKHRRGTVHVNAYASTVRMIVVESGNERAGHWMAESRDIDRDFRTAFADFWHQPTPRVTGVAIGNDTDQTHETVTAWFSDLRLGAAR